MQERLIIRNARVVDPSCGDDDVRDVGVADGLIVPPSQAGGGACLDARGLALTPGLIDLHVHLRDPGQIDKEDIASGTRAAAAGGLTAVLAMPNTRPPMDNADALRATLARAQEFAAVRVLQAGALSIGLAGRELADFAALRAAGAAALTDDGRCVQSNALMLEALRRARALGLAVLDHCEDEGLAARGCVHPGELARSLGALPMAAAAEEAVVARDAVLAREAGWPVHIQHVSSGLSVDLVRWARSRGLPLTAEAAPHHICLTAEACLEHGTNAKMNPPLRGADDRRAILDGLQDGTITVIASDHAPHTAAEKDVAFQEAPSGIVGVEVALALCLGELYHSGRLPLLDFVGKFTTGPARVLGLPMGTLAAGAPADLTFIDVDREWVIDVRQFLSRSRNCPYHGRRCRGRAVATLVGGRWAWRDPEFDSRLRG